MSARHQLENFPVAPIVSVPGPMVSAPISPEQFAAYLVSKGWKKHENDGENFLAFGKGDTWIAVARHVHFSDYTQRIAEEIGYIAKTEGRLPHEVLRDIAAMVVP